MRRGDLDALRDLFEPDVVWRGVPEDAVCHNRDEVLDMRSVSAPPSAERRADAEDEHERPPTIELLYFDGCPSHERLLPTVERLAEAAGAELRLRRADTPEAAEAERFLGSPTVRVDGVDVDPEAGERTASA